MEIGLTDEEQELLIELLDSDIGDVRGELYHAESHAAKERFREREALAKRLKARLEGSEIEEPVVT